MFAFNSSTVAMNPPILRGAEALPCYRYILCCSDTSTLLVRSQGCLPPQVLALAVYHRWRFFMVALPDSKSCNPQRQLEVITSTLA